MPNIREVADQAGVSPSTVSRVMNGLGNVRPRTRERVLLAVARLGYVPSASARALRGKPASSIALVISDVTNPFFAALTRGVEDVAQEQGYSLVLGNADHGRVKLRLYLDRLVAAGVRGAIVAPTVGARAHLRRLMRQGVTLVVVDWRYPLDGADNVYTDSVAGARELAAHMLSRGHRRIAVVTGPRGDATAEDRAAGVRRALDDAGVVVPPEAIRWGSYSVAAGARSTRQLLALRPRPTGIIAANNRIAVGVFGALREQALSVPADMSLATFDEVPFEPSLAASVTAYVQPDYEMGAAAGRLLLERLTGARDDAARREVVLQGHLLVRSSVVEPPDGDHAESAVEA